MAFATHDVVFDKTGRRIPETNINDSAVNYVIGDRAIFRVSDVYSEIAGF
jgi:hypothetical protein